MLFVTSFTEKYKSSHRMRLSSCVILICCSLAACSDSAHHKLKNKMGLAPKMPDEFAVISNEPLTVPPGLKLYQAAEREQLNAQKKKNVSRYNSRWTKVKSDKLLQPELEQKISAYEMQSPATPPAGVHFQQGGERDIKEVIEGNDGLLKQKRQEPISVPSNKEMEESISDSISTGVRKAQIPVN